MIEIAFSTSFKRAFRKRIANDVALEMRFWERLTLFQNDPFEPRLRTHKLSGQLKDLWSFSIEYDLRVVFSFIEPGKALFVDIGTHDEVY